MPDPLVARTKIAPMIDGDQVTFVWRGAHPPRLIGDFNGWQGDPASKGQGIALKAAGPKTWTYTYTLPRDAYVEYGYVRDGKRINDPLNHNLSPNGQGGVNNYFYMPDAKPSPWLARKRGLARGRVTSHVLDAHPLVIGARRRVHLYEPPEPYTRERVPLLVALDGQDYMRRVQLPALLDNLIHAGRIAPIAVAMPESARSSRGAARMSEYAANDISLGFLMVYVLPLARQHLNLLDFKTMPGTFAIAGASMGGLMSVYAALRMRGIFGTAISHAGAFELDGNQTVVHALARAIQPLPRIWLDVGTLDWLLEPNRRFHARLQDLHADVSYHEYAASHNWVAWRNILPDALAWAFPPSS